MLVALLVCQHDISDLRRLLNWISLLDGKLQHDALIACDAAVPYREALETRDEARRIFREVKFTTNQVSVTGWKEGSYSLFCAATKFIAEKWPQPFLIVEPDCVPLRKGWLDEIEAEYQKCGKSFLGCIYDCTQPGLPNRLMSGIAVYPADTATRLPKKSLPVHWDVDGAEVMVNEGAHTRLIQHFFGKHLLPPTFVDTIRHGAAENALTRDFIPPETALFHRNKDQTLMRRVAPSLGITLQHKPEETTADFVSLRRNGDIVNLLPALRKLALQWRRPIKLVVNREFLPLLDGVSYVKGVPWDGEWEQPLQAAAHFKARNAQVYGQGKLLGTGRGDFCKQAWELIGQKWNRYLPLEFDQRDRNREGALRAQAFKNGKPKILLKMEGHSSPVGNRREVEAKIKQTFSTHAEIVSLDAIMADRLYDIVGLMDEAACLVTIDTVAIHLAHASRCPIIAFVNGDGFHASPPRGNMIARIPYSQIIPKWTWIQQRIESALIPRNTNSEAVLVFSANTAKDRDTKRRQDAAYVTWPLLKARQLPFAAKRTSLQMGDQRAMPFVRDMIEAGFATGPEEVLILLNNDIKVDERLGAAIRQSCAEYGCYWAYRLDRPNGKTDQGADCFAFTRYWWTVHRHLFPDFLLGYWNWDDCLVRLMRWSGCNEQARLYYHEPHPSTQSPTRLASAGQQHNNTLWTQWLTEHQEERIKPHD